MDEFFFINQRAENAPSTNLTKLTQLPSDEISAKAFNAAEALTIIFAVLGVFTNTGNIVVFWKMGFSTVSTISFFSLSIADLLTLIFVANNAVSYSALYKIDLIVSGYHFALLCYPLKFSMMSMSSWITAVINMERCCCIMLPLKVKLIFTRRTVVCLLVGMVLYQVATLIPHYLYISVVSVTDPVTNRTKFFFDFVNYNYRLGILSLLLSFSIPTFVCFILVTIGTIFLVAKLRQSADFRKSTAVARPQKISTKDKTVSNMVIAICVIYIVCLSPNVGTFLVSTAYPQFHSFNPMYRNIAQFALDVSLIFQSICSSINLFVYLKMMSKFREIFNTVFFRVM